MRWCGGGGGGGMQTRTATSHQPVYLPVPVWCPVAGSRSPFHPTLTPAGGLEWPGHTTSSTSGPHLPSLLPAAVPPASIGTAASSDLA